jgi:hypothetical protein
MSTIPATLEQLSVPISGLTPYGQNPRRGNLQVIVDSLERHGQYRPIVVRAGTNEVLAGNHTLMAAQELGWSEIAATFVDVSDDEAARIVLVDNRATDLGSYDHALLLDLLGELAESDAKLLGTGYTDDDLDALAHLWGDPPDLDQLAASTGGVTDADRLVRLQLDVTSELRDAWAAHRERFDSDGEALAELLDAP